jgi:hypothetical protein
MVLSLFTHFARVLDARLHAELAFRFALLCFAPDKTHA